MPETLRILFLEDSPNDAELAVATLEESGYPCEWERVETREDFLNRLDAPDYDLILADYSLPSFDGVTALNLFLERGFDIPFILISGTLGEERAVESMKAGATDYVLKQHISRLGSVVRRALSEKAEQRQRKQAEEALLAAEARYRDLFENANDIIYICDLEGRFISINKKAEKLTGYTREEAIAMNFSEIVAPEHHDAVRESLSEKIEGSSDSAIYEIEIICKDGERLPVEVSTRLIREEGRPVAVQGIARDLSERKSLEEQLRQSQKMEAIGCLAGGIAHDFNNLLTAIIGYSQISIAQLDKLNLPGIEDTIHPLRENIGEVEKAARRAAALTKQLLAFSRKQLLQPKVMDLNALVMDIEIMLRRLIGEDIEMVTHLDARLGYVKADPGQIEQIIMNLVVNARDAMPEGGRLTIETANVELDEDYAGHHLETKPGSYVMLAVSDTGTGMDKETASRIFEPFFTTKTAGKGTGLGLSTVYGIVRQSGGSIYVYSEQGLGTTFKIYLPRIEGTSQSVVTRVPVAQAVQGSETILLVEDEEAVRRLSRVILQMNGYTVLEAANANEAISICDQHGGRIHLIITDVIMPLMSGRQLTEHLADSWPEMKVLYISGYTDNAIVHHGVLGSGMAFLQKPFAPDVLLRKVREVLDEPRSK